MKQNAWRAWWGRPGWERFVHGLAAGTFLLAVLVFAGLAHAVSDGEAIAWENAFMRALRTDNGPIGPPGFEGVVRDVTAMGSAVVIVTMTVLMLGALCLQGRYRIAILIGVATAGGQALNAALKNTFRRMRPEETLHLVEVQSSSFPSGHAMAASIFYLTIGALLARTARRRLEKLYFINAAVLLTAMIAFSRVYLGVHYPTDVLAGWAAGVAWAIACWFVTDRVGRSGALRPETGEPPST
jgi:undecaprenyl-diphosphatase